jgi:hypothetical protein
MPITLSFFSFYYPILKAKQMQIKVLLIVGLVFFQIQLFSQKQIHQDPSHHKLVGRADFYEVNSKYEFVHDTVFYVKTGFLMDKDPDLIERDGQLFYVVTYPNFKNGEPNRTPFLRKIKGSPKQLVHAPLGKKSGKLLLISKEKYEQLEFEESHNLNFFKTENYTLSYGVLTTPFKLRPKTSFSNFSLATDSSVAPFLGVRKRISNNKDFYLVLPLHAGISFINYQSELSDGETNESFETIPGFTFGSGLFFQVNSFMFGLSVGKDYAGSSLKTWEYQGETWLSLGLGYSFMSN